MEILGYALAVLAGVSLGMVGSGGSILTVPILVYIIGIDLLSATAYSLFIVGVSSLVGGIQHAIKRRVEFKTALLFGIPSIIAVYVTRSWILPHIPMNLFGIEKGKELFLMLLFAVIMIFAALSMLKTKVVPYEDDEMQREYRYLLILILGMVEGTVTGLVGAGGGFLIIPALVLLSKMPMKKAIGTSLFIVAAKSIIGFVGHIQTGAIVNWDLILVFTSCAISGIVIGILLSTKISPEKLKTYFGCFVLTIATYILIQTLARF